MESLHNTPNILKSTLQSKTCSPCTRRRRNIGKICKFLTALRANVECSTVFLGHVGHWAALIYTFSPQSGTSLLHDHEHGAGASRLFTPQPKLVLICRSWMYKRLSWPSWLVSYGDGGYMIRFGFHYRPHHDTTTVFWNPGSISDRRNIFIANNDMHNSMRMRMRTKLSMMQTVVKVNVKGKSSSGLQ